MAEKTIEDVQSFWEANPLFAEEAGTAPGTREYFEEHSRVYENDCFAGKIDSRIFPLNENASDVLDLGCGPGFWTVELLKRGAQRVTAADLTEKAIELARIRAEIYGFAVETSQQNAERMTFADGAFSHVNCQGVIHHTPDTEACVREIARVLRPGGTALISVYYRNYFLRVWPLLRVVGRPLSAMGGGLKGRGRESIFMSRDTEEIVRLYDGSENPIGKAYSKAEFIRLLAPHLRVEEIFFHFFPARSLPFRIPSGIHRFLDRRCGFMIFARCKKPEKVG